MFSYIAYGLIWLFSFLPLRILYLFSDISYCVLYYLIGYRKQVVRENLEHSFPEKSAGELRVIEKKFYRNLCDTFVESYKPWHMSEKEMKKRFVFKNPEVFGQYLGGGKSVIGVLGHYANWEWMSSFPLWVENDFDLFGVYKPLKNKVMDRMVRNIRSRFGSQPVPKKDILRKIIENRNKQRSFLAAFIGDQTPNSGNLNFWMEFLNQDTAVLFGTEKIANKFNLPVVSLYARKIKRGYYEVELVELCREPQRLKHGELTEMHMRVLEEQIKESPEYWLWSHRRWKHQRKTEVCRNQ